MKKFLKYGLIVIGAVILLLAGFYFLFPETAFDLAIDAQRRSADLVKKEVQVDDHRIVYLEGGTGETIVLLHGFGGYKDQWTAFAKYLKGYRLVIPDVAGFGESSRVPTANYSVESQVGRIDRFVEALKLDQFHLAGNSLEARMPRPTGKTPREGPDNCPVGPGRSAISEQERVRPATGERQQSAAGRQHRRRREADGLDLREEARHPSGIQENPGRGLDRPRVVQQ